MKKIMFNDRYGLTKAVLSGRKTMTRRVIKAPRKFRGQDVNGFYVYRRPKSSEVIEICMKDYDDYDIEGGQIRPKYDFGDIVALSQSYKDAGIKPEYIVGYENNGAPITAIQSPGWGNKMFTRPDIMPHQIRITDIRVERLQEISDDDCLKEDIEFDHNSQSYYVDYDKRSGHKTWIGSTPREAFASLIDKVSGRGTWDKNPYVFVYQFELIK